jgi:PAS domain S-box-containing protein
MEETRCWEVAGHPILKAGEGLFRFEPACRRGRDARATIPQPGEGQPAEHEHERFDRFFAHAPELFGVGTLGGVILKVNAAWQRTLGYTAEELALTSLWERIHPEARGACRSAARALARAGAVDVAVRMPHKDGSDRWVAWNLVVAAGRLFAVGHDVTERRRLETAEETTPGSAHARVAPCVLLAEGNRNSQRAAALRLTTVGFAVTLAAHGQAAVDLALAALAAGRPFDAILMDMHMPVLDGYEATRTLRGAGYRHPIIAVTAHGSTEDREECLRIGCDDHVARPIDWPRITGLIAACANHIHAPA